MNTTHSPIRRFTRSLPRIAGLAALAFAAAPGLAAPDGAAAAAPPHAPGTWVEHQYTFSYMGFTSTYSCDGLADKLKELLIAAGARADVKSEPGACATGFGHPDKFARANLTFFTLAPSDAAAPASAAGAPAVDGLWRTVKFADHSPWDLGVGDCELIEQFAHNVLPLFSTRNVVRNLNCVPHQLSGSTLDLRFDAFAAAPRVAAAT